MAAYIDNPAKSQIFDTFQHLVSSFLEVYVPSTTAIRRWEFIRLGLTDAAVLEALTDQVVLITTDLDGLDRPSQSETFQQLARVLVTGDSSLYQPTQVPNTHWANWMPK